MPAGARPTDLVLGCFLVHVIVVGGLLRLRAGVLVDRGLREAAGGRHRAEEGTDAGGQSGRQQLLVVVDRRFRRAPNLPGDGDGLEEDHDGDRERARRIVESLPADFGQQGRLDQAYFKALADPGAADEYLALAGDVDESLLAIGQQDRMMDAWAKRAANGLPALLPTRWAVRTLWMPSARSAREDPRFFEVARVFGLVRLWKTRGWPDGCRLATGDGPRHLDCAAVPPVR